MTPPPPQTPERLFVLSPARLDGVRGGRILEGVGEADVTRRLAEGQPVRLSDVYVHISSLYFRGKLAYARAFSGPGRAGGGPPGPPGRILVVTPTAGLLAADRKVSLDDLRAFARESIDAADDRYVSALVASARTADRSLGRDASVVFLGSIATPKYLEPLLRVFGSRLLVPREFVGRGDMSRGSLLLRAAEAGVELAYAAASDLGSQGSTRSGGPRDGQAPSTSTSSPRTSST